MDETFEFGYAYWFGRPYIEDYNLEAGSAAGGGLISIDSWGS